MVWCTTYVSRSVLKYSYQTHCYCQCHLNYSATKVGELSIQVRYPALHAPAIISLYHSAEVLWYRRGNPHDMIRAQVGSILWSNFWSTVSRQSDRDLLHIFTPHLLPLHSTPPILSLHRSSNKTMLVPGLNTLLAWSRRLQHSQLLLAVFDLPELNNNILSLE